MSILFVFRERQTADNRGIFITDNDSRDRTEQEREDQLLPVHLQPNQPSDLPGPKVKGERVFKTLWFKIWNWLEWNEGKAFCHTCRVAMDLKTFSKCTSDAFTVKGFSNWKHGPERFRGHEASSSHKEATLKWLHYSRSTSLSTQILLAKQKEQAQAKVLVQNHSVYWWAGSSIQAQ